MVSDSPGVEPPDELLVFVSDASAEAERLMTSLRARGYTVIDVPLSLLVSRAAVQRPALILCDVDAPAALETIHRLRDIPGAGGIDIVFLGQPGRTLDDQADAVLRESSGFFVRPVDVYALLRKVEALIGAPPSSDVDARGPVVGPQIIASSQPPPRISSAPPSPAPRGQSLESTPPSEPAAQRASSDPPARTSSSPARARLSSSPELEAEPSLPAPVPLGFGVEAEGAALPRQIPQSEMSPELEKLLARAEQRLSAAPAAPSSSASGRLSPEDEVEAVLPADVLAALDEPLDIEDDSADSEVEGFPGTRSGSESRTGTGVGAGGTYAGVLGGTSAGTVAGPLSSALPAISGPASSSRPEVWSSQTAAMQTTSPPPRPASSPPRSSEPPVTPPQAATRPPEPPSSAPPPAGTSSAAGPAAVTAVESLPDRGAPARIVGFDEPAPVPAPAPLDARRFGPPTVSQPVIHQPESERLPPPQPPPAAPVAAPLDIPAALGPGDGLRALARAVRARYTGALAFEDSAGIRRVVLRDGDFVTAASGAQGEALVAFLAARGMLPADAVARLGHRLPPFGRHAGAALIAHGHLRQDELWPVLRGHAEWIVGHVISMTGGAASLERQVPPRLQAEPAVFGGATGAEVLLEVVRRVVAPDEAITRLGGRNARLAEGPAAGLLGECALPEPEAALVSRLQSGTVQEALDGAGGDGFASALYALRELGVLDVLGPARGKEEDAQPVYDQIDDEALRERIRARKALVDEGDYFALLGLPRGATAYDIRRAYLELRREFEPSRVLTAATADLRDDAALIVDVLDEAYEILRDQRRRDRYRRALEAAPR